MGLSMTRGEWGVGTCLSRCAAGLTDGNRFVEAAVAQGAAAVVTDSREVYERLRREHAAIGVALVERGRRALAEVECGGAGASGAEAGSECGDGDEWEDDDCVFAGGRCCGAWGGRVC